jgi:hypothetical protein
MCPRPCSCQGDSASSPGQHSRRQQATARLRQVAQLVPRYLGLLHRRPEPDPYEQLLLTQLRESMQANHRSVRQAATRYLPEPELPTPLPLTNQESARQTLRRSDRDGHKP